MSRIRLIASYLKDTSRFLAFVSMYTKAKHYKVYLYSAFEVEDSIDHLWHCVYVT